MQKMIPAEDVHVFRVSSVGEYSERVRGSIESQPVTKHLPDDGQGPSVLASIRQMVPGIRPVPTIREAVGL